MTVIIVGVVLFLVGIAFGLIFARAVRGEVATTEVATPVTKPIGNSAPPVAPTPSAEQEKIQKLQMDKYAVLRDLGAGVSHEINNPLAIMLGKVQTLKIKLERGEVPKKDVVDTLDKIEHNVKRISKIVLALRLMTRDSTNEESTHIPIAGLFEDLNSVWGERLKNKGYKFEVTTTDPTADIFGKKSLLVTALFNLVSNAFDATQDLTDRWIKVEAGVNQGMLIMNVTDSGAGIPEETRRRLFDPFFTTRDAATSSGLGLAVAKGIFEIHKGSIEYDTTSPHTKFIIRLPLTGMQNQKAG